ncbi:MAG TPA: ATP-binding protein [Candidatus Methylomirabilis sp.]|nr:ATP-binding protein [Candidatus Methylomirabilis sp.]
MRNLTTRLVILTMLALMIITGVNDYRRVLRERERLVGQSEEDVRIFAETLALAVSRNVRWGRTTAELKELLDDILARPGLVAVAIYGPEGQVIAENVAADVPPPAVDRVVRNTLTTKEPALGIQEMQSGRVVRYVQPFRWPGGRTGAIEVRQTLEGMEREFQRAVQESILSRLVVLTLFVLSIVVLTRWSIARPIRALIAAARAVGRGDLDQRIDVKRRDEIGQLAEEFNRMAENLQSAHEEILRQGEERLRLEGEAQQAQKLAAVGMLAAEVAHEIGTPLNIISGRAEVLGRVVTPDQPEHRNLDVILLQTQRISKIIRALLDYTRPRRPTFRTEDVVPIIGRVSDLLLERSRRRGVRIVLDLPVGLPQIQADPDQLQQLFLNLLLNALDASPQGETVRVTVGPEPVLPAEDRAGIVRGRLDGPSLAIHIVDAGKGLTAEQLNHVFEPFFSTKSQGQGTGLGLPIVEQIVRAHHGEIEMLSIPGRGTEVILRLPLVPEPGTMDPTAATHHAIRKADANGQ